MQQMSETWASANARMACLYCGASGAQRYTLTDRKDGHTIATRVCGGCRPQYDEFNLTSRAPMHEEPGAP